MHQIIEHNKFCLNKYLLIESQVQEIILFDIIWTVNEKSKQGKPLASGICD